jgi:hypothetical protein
MKYGKTVLRNSGVTQEGDMGVEDHEFSEDTLTDFPAAPIGLPCIVRVLDFKDGRTSVSVSQRLSDPSRVWIALDAPAAAVHVSVEEGVARSLLKHLDEILDTFRSVRSRIP